MSGRGPCAPIWSWILLGLLVGDLAWGRLDLARRRDRALGARWLELARDPPGEGAGGVGDGALLDPPGLDELDLRALRALPGVGVDRALAIARARWEARGRGPVSIESIPGIGPRTAERVRAFLMPASDPAAEPAGEPPFTLRAELAPLPPAAGEESTSPAVGSDGDGSAVHSSASPPSPLEPPFSTPERAAEPAVSPRSDAPPSGAGSARAPQGSEQGGAPSPESLELSLEVIDEAVSRALREDLGPGDLTSRAIDEHVRARARLVAKQSGTLAGLGVFARTFEICDPEVEIELLRADGDEIEPGDVLARIVGNARSLLAAERTGLNFVQRMSGIATRTRAMVRAARGAARVLDTRKTTPGLRAFEKYAVLCGGGENHRFGLYDQVMVKDNHTDLAGRPLADVVRGLRESLGPDVKITAEARTLEEALAGLAGGADVLLLDNMTPDELAAATARLRQEARALRRPVEIEASGGVTLETIAEIALRTGVDRVSIGALTHSSPALDLSLYLEPLA